jgi:hypothetical protein
VLLNADESSFGSVATGIETPVQKIASTICVPATTTAPESGVCGCVCERSCGEAMRGISND